MIHQSDQTKSIAVVVLNWNGKNDTLSCLHSLISQRKVELKIIVVDNGSIDDSIEAITQKFPECFVIPLETNMGYSGGGNVGINLALEFQHEFIMLLNNDTILDQFCIYHLRNLLLNHPNTAAVAPISYWYDNPKNIYYAGGYIDSRGYLLHDISGMDLEIEQDFHKKTEWLNGCSILFRSNILREIGGFCDDYFLLFEDADWSMRARRKGYDLRIATRAKLWHKGAASFTNNWMYIYYYARNNLLWIDRNVPLTLQFKYRYFALKRILTFTNSKEPISYGYRDYFLRRFGRRQYQRSSPNN